MEMVIIVVIVLAVAAYYGFTKSLETGANIANREVEHLDNMHKVAIVTRTAKMADKIDEDTVRKAAEVKAKMAELFKD